MFWRGKNKFSYLEMVGSKTVIGFPSQRAASLKGNTYYVDHNDSDADDSNEGTDVNYPLATFDAALGKCANGNDDYIFAHDCWQEEATITVDKTTVHIIGLSSPYATWACLNADDDYPIFTLSSLCNYSEIAGFVLGGGSSYAGIDLGNAVSQWIHHNTFGHSAAGDTPLYGICADQANPADALIEYNTFMGDQVGSKGTIISNAIYQEQVGSSAGFVSSVIRNNVFLGIEGATDKGAIRLDGAGAVQVLDNTFTFNDATANGQAINILATYACAGCIITGNRAMNGMLSSGYTYTPYRDLNANTLNHWGLNYMGNRLVEPVGV